MSNLGAQVTTETSQPLRLGDYILNSAEVCRLAGISDRTLRNWILREVLPAGGRVGGRLAFSLADALRLAAMHDLTARAQVPPAIAVKVAEVAVREIRRRATDDLADVNAVPATLALAVAWKDGEPHVQLVDQAQPGGYLAWQGEWGRVHIVLPLSGLLANVLWTAIDAQAARKARVA